MSEIFKEAQGFDNHPNRWNHDLSHKSYGTFKAGIIYPVMSQFMQPTDSIKVDAAALLQFMPTPTPLQSNVRVIFHSFFQRMKNIVESFPNFIEQLEEHEMPYIFPSVTEFKAGSLHDYLDVNCNVVVNGDTSIPSPFFSFVRKIGVCSLSGTTAGKVNQINGTSASVTATSGIIFYGMPTKFVPSQQAYSQGILEGYPMIQINNVYRGAVMFSAGNEERIYIRCSVRSADSEPGAYFDVNASGARSFVMRALVADHPEETRAVPTVDLSIDYATFLSKLEEVNYEDGEWIQIDVVYAYDTNATASLNTGDLQIVHPYGTLFPDLYAAPQQYTAETKYYIYGSYSLADFPHLCPYACKEFSGNPIKIRAYRHRVYESIYNAFYRNINGNQPFLIDGRVQYNKYNTTKAEGRDETNYHFFTRNWELDAYTSCLPSPQQGNPPMVGVTATGRLTVEDDDGTRSTAQLVDLGKGQQGLGITEHDHQSRTAGCH